jgi:2-alkyl-3-oxoalkanoate reductase
LPLVRALCTLGHRVTGMTRAGRGVDHLRELGAEASSADAFDSKAVRTAIQAASPDVVIDQLTSLPANPADILKSIRNDTRLHREGGGNLLAAAQELGVGRYILQLPRCACRTACPRERQAPLRRTWRDRREHAYHRRL